LTRQFRTIVSTASLRKTLQIF